MVNLITAQEVIDYSPVEHKFDPRLVERNIPEAEFRFFKRWIKCDAFYNELLAERTAGAFSDANQKLWNGLDGSVGLVKFLALCVLYESLPTISHKITSQGIMRSRTEYGDSSTTWSDVKGLLGWIYNKAETLRDDIQVYLNENIDDYPTLKACWKPGSCNSNNNNGFDSMGVIIPVNKDYTIYRRPSRRNGRNTPLDFTNNSSESDNCDCGPASTSTTTPPNNCTQIYAECDYWSPNYAQ